MAQVTFRVIADDEKPVPGAVVTAGFPSLRAAEGFGKDAYQEIKAATDEQGFATIGFALGQGVSLRYL